MVKRAGICIDVGEPEEVHRVDEWFSQWRSALSHVSDNEGCGCCVNMWYVEGPDEAIDQLPADAAVFRGDQDPYWAKYDAS
jgi:hypothetical protein